MLAGRVLCGALVDWHVLTCCTTVCCHAAACNACDSCLQTHYGKAEKKLKSTGHELDSEWANSLVAAQHATCIYMPVVCYRLSNTLCKARSIQYDHGFICICQCIPYRTGLIS
jgi:hypothetical protein